MDALTRRRFLSRATLAIGAVLAAGWAIPAVAYVFGPAGERTRTSEWLPLGSPDKVELGTPTLFKARVERTVGWVSQLDEISVYVFTENGRVFTGLSNVCTHLGCKVRWVADQETFFCPCHNASFSKTGAVVDGPPPRPLDTYDVKVEAGQLIVNLEI